MYIRIEAHRIASTFDQSLKAKLIVRLRGLDTLNT
jgi:hypothetical protein